MPNLYEDIEIQEVGFELREKLNNLPRLPGVYQFKNEEGKIIYVGKAKILRNRVRSYFQKGHDQDPKTKVMISKVADLEVIVTDTEMEALILENTLIKKFKPRYNIDLRDDKSYPYIVVTNEPYPRVYVTRKIRQDGSRYYGPYTDVKTMRFALKSVRDIFQIRSCRLPLTTETIARKKWKICLDYHIGKCGGPCEGLVTQEEYKEMISQVERLLKGKTHELIAQLAERMREFSDRLEFEKAGDAKKKIDAIKVYTEKQKMVSLELIERDIIAVVSEGDDGCGVIFKVRDGKLIGKQHYYLSNVSERSESEMIETLIERYYIKSDYVPAEIYLSAGPIDEEFVGNLLNSKRGGEVKIVVPVEGEDLKLVKMCRANAKYMLDELKIQKEKSKETVPHTLQALQRDLHLPAPPRRIECFDNSNIQGSDPVASMVVFVDGKPRKSDYRKFKIRTVVGPDDFASMEEVIERRYTRVMREGRQLPDLVVVDGGKGQLSSAVEVLRTIGLPNQPIIGLAKRLEEVFVPDDPESILLPRTSSALKLLQQVRDEAHRFAITFHRSLREKRVISTELTEIDGVGQTRATKLLQQFGSAKGVQQASLEELARIVGMKAAQNIKVHFGSQAAENGATLEST
ncbi:MAG: excinuclease ABC subunit UvrC [Bacteroidetes bacterium]|nr:excinuclease ABC subunit UvrC [Bacteroidota bacterium]